MVSQTLVAALPAYPVYLSWLLAWRGWTLGGGEVKVRVKVSECECEGEGEG